MFPSKLLPTTEKDILKEISDDLKLPYKDVYKTFIIWLDFIEEIARHSEQSTITFPNIGKAYLSLIRLKDCPYAEYQERYRKRVEKINEIPKDKNFHRLVPVNLIYGVGKKNYRLSTTENQYFTLEELIRRQYELFFKEDLEFRERQNVYEEYFKDMYEPQKIIKYYEKNNKDNSFENSEQKENDDAPLV